MYPYCAKDFAYSTFPTQGPPHMFMYRACDEYVLFMYIIIKAVYFPSVKPARRTWMWCGSSDISLNCLESRRLSLFTLPAQTCLACLPLFVYITRQPSPPAPVVRRFDPSSPKYPKFERYKNNNKNTLTNHHTLYSLPIKDQYRPRLTATPTRTLLLGFHRHSGSLVWISTRDSPTTSDKKQPRL